MLLKRLRFKPVKRNYMSGQKLAKGTQPHLSPRHVWMRERACGYMCTGMHLCMGACVCKPTSLHCRVWWVCVHTCAWVCKCTGWGENGVRTLLLFLLSSFLRPFRHTEALFLPTRYLETPGLIYSYFRLFAVEMVFSQRNSCQRYSFRKMHSQSLKRKSIKGFENCTSWLNASSRLWLDHSLIFNFPLNCFNYFACHLILIFKFLAFLHLFFFPKLLF